MKRMGSLISDSIFFFSFVFFLFAKEGNFAWMAGVCSVYLSVSVFFFCVCVEMDGRGGGEEEERGRERGIAVGWLQ